MYEANRRGDGAQPDNMVRSQFGSPAASGNGDRPNRPGDATGEQYRFDPSRPRRRRYAATDEPTVIDGDSTDDDTPDTAPGQWSVNRDDIDTSETRELPSRPRTPIPRSRRRHAAADDDTATTADDRSPADRSADLDRIATFLRSTQESQDSVRRAIDTSETAETRGRHTADNSPGGRHSAPDEKTSELPTVPASADAATTKPSPHATPEQVLDAVRQVPGVALARLSDTDQTLSLDIADEADADEVHRRVAAILDSRLGLRARPVATTEPLVAEPRRPIGAERVVVERVQAVMSGFEATIEVALAAGGTRVVGRSVAPAVDWHVHRGAAEATVDAIGTLLGNKARVVIEHAAIETAGPIKVAIVVVLLLTEAGAEQLAGAAPATGDRRQAVVHATLSALNRRIDALLR